MSNSNGNVDSNDNKDDSNNNPPSLSQSLSQSNGGDNETIREKAKKKLSSIPKRLKVPTPLSKSGLKMSYKSLLGRFGILSVVILVILRGIEQYNLGNKAYIDMDIGLMAQDLSSYLVLVLPSLILCYLGRDK